MYNKRKRKKMQWQMTSLLIEGKKNDKLNRNPAILTLGCHNFLWKIEKKHVLPFRGGRATFGILSSQLEQLATNNWFDSTQATEKKKLPPVMAFSFK